MIARCGLLIGLTLGCWALAVIPCVAVWGTSVLLTSGVAVLVCLVPSVATLAWASAASRQGPDQQLVMVLGGTSVRLFVVLGAALGLHMSLPYFQQHQEFWWWLVAFYLLTLAGETTLSMRSQPIETR